MGATPLDHQVTGIAAAPDGKGYRLVGSDGGVFAFGDAGFYASLGSTGYYMPIMGMSANPDGGGYWLVASDESLFPFGDARHYVPTGANVPPNQPVVGIATNADGHDHWEVAADGGVFSDGDAHFYGSVVGHPLNHKVLTSEPPECLFGPVTLVRAA